MAATEKTNVEIAEELYEAFNQGDIETCLAGFADDITWTEPEESPMIGGHTMAQMQSWKMCLRQSTRSSTPSK
ncbi:nuclear transport factor 2 family protein [Natrinema sp. SYSU A 869]|uniref:nuclear transport factor 2 family protein n=1 Tax=Natrinema sp. SYSU A 869 TaxID=2871694 RepID=UPI00210201AB|nr:nuclear transport factor 2 family protein [Natrinema sp. SYSU A 869]